MTALGIIVWWWLTGVLFTLISLSGCSLHYCMGESTSVFIRRFVKLKCAYGDLDIVTISRIKRIKKRKEKLFRFRSAIWSDPYTQPLADPCFLKLTCAHTLPEVVKIVVNWRDPCFIHLRSPEQFEKNAVFVREGYELSIAIDKNVKNKWNWKWIQEVDADGVPFQHWCRKFDKPRVATKNYQLKKKKQWKGERNWAWRWTSDPSSRNFV